MNGSNVGRTVLNHRRRPVFAPFNAEIGCVMIKIKKRKSPHLTMVLYFFVGLLLTNVFNVLPIILPGFA